MSRKSLSDEPNNSAEPHSLNDDDVIIIKRPTVESADRDVVKVIQPESQDVDEEDERRNREKNYSKARRIFESIIPPGGIVGSSYTIGSSTLGAGILGLPSAFNNMGLATALIILMIVVVQTVFALWLLARASDATGLRTYEEVVRALLGRGPDYGIALFMIGFCVGGAVSYVVSIGDLLTPIFDDDSVPQFLRTKTGNRVITTLIWLVCILPLCLPKNIDSLRHTSMVGVTFVAFFVGCIIVNSCQFLAENGWRDDVKAFGTGNSAIQGLGTVLFACLVEINAFEVYYEMRNRTPRRMVVSSSMAMGVCGLLYVCAGLFGYARFGSTVTSSILLMYQPRLYPVFWVAYCGVVFKICVAFALHQLPMRDGFYHFLKWDVYRMPWWKNAVCMAALSTFTLIVGLMVPNLNVVLGLVGSLCGGFLGFIYPALMIMYTGNWTLTSVGWVEYFSTYFLLLTGVIAAVFGTAAAIYGVIPG